MRKIFNFLFFLILSYFFCSGPVHAVIKVETITFKTQDNQQLNVNFIKPKPGFPVVVMLHGMSSVKEEWNPLAEKLSGAGWGVFAYDARYQASKQIFDDLGAAIQFLKKQPDLKEPSLFLCGASLGANVALNYASLTRSIKAVVLLSPGLSYGGIQTESALPNMKHIPVLIVASELDAYAFKSSGKLYAEGKALKQKGDPISVEFWSDVKPGHGVQMFDEKLLQRIVQWLTAHR